MSSNVPHRVFISHSSEDHVFVERYIIPLLEEHGIPIWYSKNDIQTASHWADVIKHGLESCDWFLVVMSPRSLSSQWVKAELDWALEERRNRIVPVLMEACEWKQFHLLLRLIQHVDYSMNPEEAPNRLLRVWGIVKRVSEQTTDKGIPPSAELPRVQITEDEPTNFGFAEDGTAIGWIARDVSEDKSPEFAIAEDDTTDSAFERSEPAELDPRVYDDDPEFDPLIYDNEDSVIDGDSAFEEDEHPVLEGLLDEIDQKLGELMFEKEAFVFLMSILAVIVASFHYDHWLLALAISSSYVVIGVAASNRVSKPLGLHFVMRFRTKLLKTAEAVGVSLQELDQLINDRKTGLLQSCRKESSDPPDIFWNAEPPGNWVTAIFWVVWIALSSMTAYAIYWGIHLGN